MLQKGAGHFGSSPEYLGAAKNDENDNGRRLLNGARDERR
jgi:hypothetical protein